MAKDIMYSQIMDTILDVGTGYRRLPIEIATQITRALNS